MTNGAEKVYIVFENAYLMKRDKDDFEDWWSLLNFETKIEYCVGIDFESSPNELIIVDEADSLIFSELEGP